MQTAQQSNGRWVPCDSRNTLVAQLPPNACELLITESPNSWGYMVFDSNVIVPIGYADMGLLPVAVKHEDRIFVGIDELLVGYDGSSLSCLFKYKMPTVFHEFVRFDQNELIVRDEIGFVGISYAGDERWNFCIDVIADYEINQSTILGKTEEGENFEFTIPFEENLTHPPAAGSC
jgi:hypothetical protein